MSLTSACSSDYQRLRDFCEAEDGHPSTSAAERGNGAGRLGHSGSANALFGSGTASSGLGAMSPSPSLRGQGTTPSSIGPPSLAVPTPQGSQSHHAAGKARHITSRAKKGRRMTWLVVDEGGNRQTIQMDKRQLTQVMGLEIPMRDLRLMDPALQAWEAYAQLLVRDNAMVFSVEHVRLIIASDKVLVPLDFERTEAAERFCKVLEGVLRERAATMVRQPEHSATAGDLASSMYRQHSTVMLKDPELLPFELAVLEAALGEVCRMYASQTTALEAVALPALDALTRNADTVNLERVRKIKTQHQRLGGRVSGLREVLERFMEDDQDMWRMCLSKRREQDLENTGSDNTFMLGRTPARHHGLTVPRLRSLVHPGRSPPPFLEQLGSLRHQTADNDSSTDSDALHDLLEVENLLESYYMMIDSTHQKLANVGEYIDDTEDYINIELDYNRNRLLKIEILLTIATFTLAIYNLVAGILGENLVLPAAITADLWGFIIINGSTVTLCTLAFAVTVSIMRGKKLI